jgi:putative ABC transport system permease protein
MHFLSLPLKNLLRRPLRSCLTMTGVCGAVAGFVVLVSMSRGIESAWTSSAQQHGIHMFGISRDAVELLTGSFDEDLGLEIAREDGVEMVSGEMLDLTRLENLDESAKVILRGWPAGSFLWETVRLDTGSRPSITQTHSVIVGAALARMLNVLPGGTVRIKNRSFTISGTAATAGVMNDMCIILPLATLQQITGRNHEINQFCLRLRDPGNESAVRELKEQLNRKFDDLAFHTTEEVAQNNGILRIFRAMTWGISLAGMIMAGIIVLNTLLITVTERTGEIGLLAAVGWTPARILFLILAEGVFLTLMGTLAGILLGIPCLHWLVAQPALHGLFEPEVSLQLALRIIPAALMTGAIGSFYPALRAMRLSPVQALRSE